MPKQSELKKYFKDLYNALDCTIGTKQQILQRIRYDVDEYVAAHPNSSISEIESVFGTPAAYAKEMLTITPEEEVHKGNNIRKYQKKTILLTCLTVVVLVSALVIGIAVYNQSHTGNQHDTNISNNSEEITIE